MLGVISNDPTRMTLSELRGMSSAIVSVSGIHALRAAQKTAAATSLNDVNARILQTVQRSLDQWFLLVIHDGQQEFEDLTFAGAACLVHLKHTGAEQSGPL